MKDKLTPFQLEALDHTKHIALTANAGSGKTFVFAKRFVEIALQNQVSLRNIVAITFTDKAAGELNVRISKEVEDRLLTETDSQRLKKLRQIRRGLVSANISTIHSFCIELLKEFSTEAGIDAGFVPIEPRYADELLELSIDECINSFEEDQELANDFKVLVRLLGSKKMFRQELISLIDKRKTINLIKEKYKFKDAKTLIEEWKNLFISEFNTIFESRIKQLLLSVKKLNDEVASAKSSTLTTEIDNLLEKLGEKQNPLEIIPLLTELQNALLTKGGTVKKKEYAPNDVLEFLNQDVTMIESFFGDFERIKYDENYEGAEIELVEISKSFFRIFEKVEDKYQEKKEARGYLDFEDILLYALKLTAIQHVTEQLGQKYNYVMIDEYQDTNDVQYNIFMPVLDNLKQGNLFVVGDEKQSIYMFRDADIAVYQKTKEDMKYIEGSSKLLELPHSFRMYPQIAAFTNYIFRNMLKESEPLFGDVGYSELVCAKETSDEGKVELLLCENENSQSEAELVAQRILQLIDVEEEISLSEVAVLCRKRSNFKELEESFNKHGIPYLVVGGKGFYQQQIVYDVFNYLSFLIDNNNDTALIGLLRSPFYTLSDGNIYELSMQEGNNFYEKLKVFVDKRPFFKKIISLLELHQKYSVTHTISQLLREIFNDTGYWAFVAALPDSDQQIMNLEKLINISLGFTTQSFVTLYDFVVYLKNAIESIEDEGQAVVEENLDAAKILTIHQSKGLEFQAVFLYKCAEYGKDSRVRSKELVVDKKYGVLAKVYPGNNYFDEPVTATIVSLYNYVSVKKQNAELKRLLYVGITRAIKFLFVTASIDKKEREDSFWGLILKGLGEFPSGDAFTFNEVLKIMYNDNGEFKTKTEPLEHSIQIIKNIEISPKEKDQLKPDELTLPEIKIDEITDSIRQEIVSATKVAVYSQCPLKYQLTYEFGFSDLAELAKKQSSQYDYKYKEDDETKGYGDVKGRIIHHVLDKEFSPEVLSTKLDELLLRELPRGVSEDRKKNLKTEITNLLTSYFSSMAYGDLNKSKTYFNEFEVYSLENDYYLYGIIDKLIINPEKLVIIDYKTDNISKDEIEEKGNDYLLQLKFYANLVRKRFNHKGDIEVRIIFIHFPDEVFIRKITNSELDVFSNDVKEIIGKIRNKSFEPNKAHCYKCHFTVSKNKCIKVL